MSVDARGDLAYRMALQTRNSTSGAKGATSNICTAQALLATIAGFYAVYHGPKGLVEIARRIHGLAKLLDRELKHLGYRQANEHFFDTLKVELPDRVEWLMDQIHDAAIDASMNFRYVDEAHIGIALDETTSVQDVRDIAKVFARPRGAVVGHLDSAERASQLPLDYPSA